MPIYEYLSVELWRKSNDADNARHKAKNPKWSASHKDIFIFSIIRDAEAKPQLREGANIIELFNELGQEGWKMVDSQIVEAIAFDGSAEPDGHKGWLVDGSTPIVQRWIFMKETLSR